MPQATQIIIPWPVVIVGIILAIALTVLIVVLLVKAFSRRRHEWEETDDGSYHAYEKRKWEPEKTCPRCDLKVKITARYCDDCGKAL